MIKYSVRSRQLIDVVGDIKRSKIVISPYFQRNLVWRLIHKQDFVKTILLGYPFPQIFLAKGGIDVDELTSISLIVDGQQRMKSIIDFIDGKFDVEGFYFNDLTRSEKDAFLTYEIAIIELQLEADNPEIKEVFQRLNRTFYSLTNIEKLSTEYAPSEIMLLAKLLSKDLEPKLPKEHNIDPNIPESFILWAQRKKVTYFNKLILECNIFSAYEVSRKVPLMILLNILGTIERGFFNRNIPASMLDEYADNYPNKDEVIERLENVAKFYIDMDLPSNSYWINKANFFSLIVIFYNNPEILTNTPRSIKEKLINFEKTLPEDYQLAAKEAVNNKKERIKRNQHLEKILK
ncbi:MAG: DUF262 domain-containing protein [Syntrophaceae bacterium]|nr:DUF262 domain-containing protein [Syntrophaceae bacterium]